MIFLENDMILEEPQQIVQVFNNYYTNTVERTCDCPLNSISSHSPSLEPCELVASLFDSTETAIATPICLHLLKKTAPYTTTSTRSLNRITRGAITGMM